MCKLADLWLMDLREPITALPKAKPRKEGGRYPQRRYGLRPSINWGPGQNENGRAELMIVVLGYCFAPQKGHCVAFSSISLLQELHLTFTTSRVMTWGDTVVPAIVVPGIAVRGV